MLTYLRVKNLALISDVELELSGGLTVLTGETGAGKSLLIQAISLLTGKRPSEALLRRGEDRAVVEGIFTLDEGLRNALEEAGYPIEDGSLHVRRILRRNGPNRALINGETATLATLRSLLGERLQISGQHEHTMLKDPEIQLWMLDAFGKLQEKRAAFGELFRSYKALSARLRDLKHREEKDRTERELAAFQLDEISAAALSKEEYDQLREEKGILNHTESLLRNLRQVLDTLHEAEFSALPQVQNALSALEEMADIDPRLKEPLKSLREAEIYLDEVAGTLQHYGAKIEFDPQRLEEIEERLATYAALIQKYGGSLEAVFQTATRLKDRLQASESLEETIRDLEREKAQTAERLMEAGRLLSAERKKAASGFSKAMTASLKELGMKTAVFQVTVGPDPFPDAPDPAAATETGFDTVSFLFSANKGEPPLPMKDIASGGELSRILLAAKALISGGIETQTVVFDEVDAGIGGRVADIVGRRIADIARQTQILCITHLPQIAAYGDHHLCLTKEETATHTRIGVKRLEEEERIPELARMLGGETITKTTLRHAGELLSAARSRKGKTP